MAAPSAGNDPTAGNRDATTAAAGRESTVNLLRLFKVEPTHRVITRQDLFRVYDAIPPWSSTAAGLPRDADRDNGNEDSVAINHYYTWNSSRTNASIHKERAAIISALHSPSKSAATTLPALPRPRLSLFVSRTPLPPSKSFTRSHRVRDIVSMCSEGRCAFSADEYHNNETAAAADDEEAPSGHAAAFDGRRPHVGRGSRCWSCTATAGSDEDGDENAVESDRARPRSAWKRRLSRLLPSKKRDRRR